MKLALIHISLICLCFSAAAGAGLWRDPGPAASLDLATGPGGREKAPVPPFVFIEEGKGGTSPKVFVRDARGAVWIVKFGEEVKAETFATRILWAAGYYADPTHFVKEGRIEGAHDLGRARPFIGEGNGAFRDARFQLKHEEAKKTWKLDDANLKGSRELAGYKTLAILLANWDLKPENFSIVSTKNGDRYVITDWGATMGRSAELTGRAKWNCDLYTTDSQYLVDGVENGYVFFNHQGKQGQEARSQIRLEDVKWLMQRLGSLTDAQIISALQASGATPAETSCFAKAFRARLNRLANVEEETVSRTRTIRRETRTIP